MFDPQAFESDWRKRTVSHPLLRRILDAMISCEDMVLMDDLARDAAWLRLPLERRWQAVRRHAALEEYKAGEATMERAQRLAAEAGISVSSLYKLLPKWDKKDGPDIWALVPYTRSIYDGRSRLAPDTENMLHRLIDAAMKNGIKGTVGIAAEVIANWPEDGPAIPNPTTVRSHVDSRGGFDSVEKGTISLNTGLHAQETADTATHYGEVLVIDHSAADFFIEDSKSPKRATLTFAIDLHTATIAGRCVSKREPAPYMVTAALDDAQRRGGRTHGEAVRPRLLYAATNGDDWRSLVETIDERGLKSKVRWGTRLHFGGPIRRMIGTSLDDIKLHSRKKHHQSNHQDRFDPKKHALVTIEEAQMVLNYAIERFNAQRLNGYVPVPIETGMKEKKT